jgi:hypothetical protein
MMPGGVPFAPPEVARGAEPPPALAVPEAPRLFCLLSASSRLRILLHLLDEGGASMGDLVEAAGRSRPDVANHLGLPRRDRLLESQRGGHRVPCGISSLLVAEAVERVREG